jgi:hypothetical protein
MVFLFIFILNLSWYKKQDLVDLPEQRGNYPSLVRIEVDDLEKGSAKVPKDITVEQINVKAGGAALDVRDMAIMQDEIRFTVGGDLGKNTRL